MGRFVASEGVLGGVDIESQVDTSIVQRLHAGIVVGSVVDCVDTNGVDLQFLELSNITGAGGFVGKRVRSFG